MFKVGDFVKFKDGVMDADENKYDLGGWQGHVIEVDVKKTSDDENMYLIHWDTKTMENIPEGYIQTCNDEGLSLTTYRTLENDLLQAIASETLQTSKEFASEFGDAHFFNDGSPVGNVIMEVIDGDEDEIEAYDKWLEYLEENMTFPCSAEVMENRKSPLRMGEKVSITGLYDEPQDLYGIIAKIKVRGQKMQFPLCNLEGGDEVSENATYLEAYATWFANR